MALNSSLCKQNLAVQHGGRACNRATAPRAPGTRSDVAWATIGSTLHNGLGCPHLTRQLHDQSMAACEQTRQQATPGSCPDSTATTNYL